MPQCKQFVCFLDEAHSANCQSLDVLNPVGSSFSSPTIAFAISVVSMREIMSLMNVACFRSKSNKYVMPL